MRHLPLHPIAAAVITTFGVNAALADTGNIRVSISYPGMMVIVPSGVTTNSVDLLVVPRNSPLPSNAQLNDSAFRMYKQESANAVYEINSASVQPTLGGNNIACQTQCTLTLNITNPTQPGSLLSPIYFGWDKFAQGDYDLLVQDSEAQITIYSVPFTYAPNEAPVASNVAINGVAREGSLLTGQYTYSDAENNLESTSTFRWVRNSVTTGVAGGTTVGTARSYTPVQEDVSKYLYFCITPVADVGNLTGAEVCSAATPAILSAPILSSGTGNIQVTVNHPNMTVTVPTGIAPNNIDLLVVPRNSPLPSGAELSSSAYSMFKLSSSGARYFREGETVQPTLGGESIYCPGQCTLNLNITSPVNPGTTGVASSPQFGWDQFIDGDYDLLVQDSASRTSVYSVPFTYAPNAAPLASNVSISGTVREGSLLTGGYVFSDAESNPEGASTFRWVRNSTNTGVAGGTTLAGTRTYTPTPADVGNYLYFCVTPVANAGTLTGAEACSAATAAVTAAPVNGICGAASNTATAFTPSANLCTTGSASPVTTSSASWGWSCSGTNGGTAASCSAPFASLPGSGGKLGIIQAASANNWQVRTTDSGFVALPSPAPTGVTFPNGATKVVLDAGTQGSSATVTLRFNDIPTGAKLYKFGKETGLSDTDKWFEYPATIDFNAKTVSYTLTDGQKGDNDWVANGVINDPVALGVSSSSASVAGIPTLSEWGLMMLSALMALGTLGAMRRRTR